VFPFWRARRSARFPLLLKLDYALGRFKDGCSAFPEGSETGNRLQSTCRHTTWGTCGGASCFPRIPNLFRTDQPESNSA
jgi:hypothetical protein